MKNKNQTKNLLGLIIILVFTFLGFWGIFWTMNQVQDLPAEAGLAVIVLGFMLFLGIVITWIIGKLLLVLNEWLD